MQRPLGMNEMKLSKLMATALMLLCATRLGFAASQDEQPKKANVWEEYRIGPEDILTISIWKDPDLSRKVHVRPDGMISLSLLNDVMAAGLTPMELRDVITKRLAEYVSSPEVSVIIDQIKSFKVSILGKVTAPGRYELRSPTTVLEALALAGGMARTEFDSPDEIIVLRPKEKTMERIVIKYKVAISAAGKTVNVALQPNDIVVVP